MHHVQPFTTYSLWRAFAACNLFCVAIRSALIEQSPHACAERCTCSHLQTKLQNQSHGIQSHVSLYLIALRLSLAGCAAHSPTARLDARAAASDSTHWQRLLFVRFRSAFRFYVVVNFVMYLGPSIQNVSSRNPSTLLEISRRHDHTQQDLVRSLEVLLYFKYRT